MTIPEKYAILRTENNYKQVNGLINRKYQTTFYLDDNYILVNTKYVGSLRDSARKASYLPVDYTLVTYEEFLEILTYGGFKEAEKVKKNELRGVYRERLKALEDTIVELRYENQQLKQELALLTPVTC